MTTAIVWERSADSFAWDTQLAALGGHPLQSALWGDARAQVDGIRSERWAASIDDQPVLLARVERRAFGPLRVAWLPRGPVVRTNTAVALADLLSHLRDRGYALCVADPYRQLPDFRAVSPFGKPATAVVDLDAGRAAVWAAFDSQVRYSVRSAARDGVSMEESRDPRDIEHFFALCEHISRFKGFDLSGSAELMKTLLSAGPSENVEARLFVARYQSHLAAGAIVLRCGDSLHYFWGGVDRRFSKLRAGDALQAHIIDWALGQGIRRYDLEGIDPEANLGTYRFKMKLGASAVPLPGRYAYPLSALGRAAANLGRWTGRI